MDWNGLSNAAIVEETGKRDDFTLKDLLRVAGKSDIKNAQEIVQQIIEVVSQWKNYAHEADVNPKHIKQIQQTFRIL
jgi:serine/threonine-protein kinase HipA